MTQSSRAKAKLEAVLNNPNRHDSSGQKDRVLPETHPSVGYRGESNRIERRMSHTYRAKTVNDGRLRALFRNFWGPPAA